MWDNFEQIPHTERPEAIRHAWSGAEYPLTQLDPEDWIELFDTTGYFVDNTHTNIETDLAEEVTLYRGSPHQTKQSMSWTRNPDAANWFATRWGNNHPVHKIIIPRSYCMARITTRGEDEVIVPGHELWQEWFHPYTHPKQT